MTEFLFFRYVLIDLLGQQDPLVFGTLPELSWNQHLKDYALDSPRELFDMKI